MTAPSTTRRWPWVVFGCVLLGLVVSDAVTGWQLRVGYTHPYGYWLETTVGTLAYAVVGLLISTRVVGNRLGPLMLGLACASVVQDLSGVLSLTVVHVEGPTTFIAVLGGVFGAAQFVVVSLALLLLMLAPTGRPLDRTWLWIVRAFVTTSTLWVTSVLLSGPTSDSLDGYPSGVAIAPDFAVPFLGLVMGVTSTAVMLGVPLGATCLALRWFKANGEPRRQVTWVVIGGIAGPAIIIIDGFISHWHQGPLHGSLVWACAGAALPAGIAVAVLRHGLYELDRVVSRTVSYTLVSGVVIAIYAITVTAFSRLLGHSPSFAIAAATLMAAAAFQPLLRSIRTRVDRRFDRSRYDGETLVAQFAHRLEREVDLESVASGLSATVQSTVSPTSCTLWLRTPS
ncbi:MAG: hypothetical protein WAN48_00275 [Actinomycetes bacterium]